MSVSPLQAWFMLLIERKQLEGYLLLCTISRSGRLLVSLSECVLIEIAQNPSCGTNYYSQLQLGMSTVFSPESFGWAVGALCRLALKHSEEAPRTHSVGVGILYSHDTVAALVSFIYGILRTLGHAADALGLVSLHLYNSTRCDFSLLTYSAVP